MKTIVKIVPLIVIAGLLFSCGETVDDPMKDIAQYSNIYLRQAYDYPYLAQLDVSDEVQTIFFNACLGGYVSNNNNIAVNFAVSPESVAEFNAANGTNYPLLSAASYTIGQSQCVIPPGELNSSKVNINLVTEGYLIPGEPQLLPITISSVDEGFTVNEKLKTVYFLISGTYPLGEEPPVKVFDASDKTIKNLFMFYNYLVICEPEINGGIMQYYAYNAGNETFDSNITGVQWYGWDGFDWTIPYIDAILGHYPNGAVIYYSWDRNTAMVNSNLGTLVTLNGYSKVFSSFDQQCLFCVDAYGNMTALPVLSANLVDAAINMGSGWDAYVQILAYGSDLLAIDNAGNLWLIPVDNQKNVGEKKQIGSGWNKYSIVTAFGSDLLALDANKILWKYHFDINGFWDVSK
ncbi:MAG: DUF1735 domain-containing protein [Dysgonamonadaceae bacterium]|jgi:hypothetical protein|nr:DUF1735 domain-containing protein [Dysgonamonadaceae bacterium]